MKNNFPGFLVLTNPRIRELDAGRMARQTGDPGRQPALGLLSKAAGSDRPPFLALPRGFGILLLLALLATGLQASPLSDARARYADGEYELAAKLFEQSLETSPPQAAVLFELGRCLRQTGEDARAALSFRRALVLDPRFAPAQVALSETNTDLGIPKPGKNWKSWVLDRFPIDALVLAGSSLFWIGAFSLLAFLRPPHAKGRLALGILCTVCGAASLVLAWICDPRITDRNTALVLASGGTTMRSSPAEQSEKVAPMPEGSTVTILSQRGRWFFGSLPDGKRGWFVTDGIFPIIPPA